MSFTLLFTRDAAAVVAILESRPQYAAQLVRVRTALGRLQLDPLFPALRSHEYVSLSGRNGEVVWDSYVENRTAASGRIFWHYGPGPESITVVLITPLPLR